VFQQILSTHSYSIVLGRGGAERAEARRAGLAKAGRIGLAGRWARGVLGSQQRGPSSAGGMGVDTERGGTGRRPQAQLREQGSAERLEPAEPR
jgi:hypothetical protein